MFQAAGEMAHSEPPLPRPLRISHAQNHAPELVRVDLSTAHPKTHLGTCGLDSFPGLLGLLSQVGESGTRDQRCQLPWLPGSMTRCDLRHFPKPHQATLPIHEDGKRTGLGGCQGTAQPNFLNWSRARPVSNSVKDCRARPHRRMPGPHRFRAHPVIRPG